MCHENKSKNSMNFFSIDQVIIVQAVSDNNYYCFRLAFIARNVYYR